MLAQDNERNVLLRPMACQSRLWGPPPLSHGSLFALFLKAAVGLGLEECMLPRRRAIRRKGRPLLDGIAGKEAIITAGLRQEEEDRPGSNKNISVSGDAMRPLLGALQLQPASAEEVGWVPSPLQQARLLCQ